MKISFLILGILILCCSCVTAQQSWCGSQTVYFQHNASTSPPGYEELINYPSGNPEVDESVSAISTGGSVLIDNYIIPEGSMRDVSELLQGLRRYRFYAYVDSAVGTTTLNFTAFKRFANGTEVNFYSARTDDINSLTVSEYDLNYVSQSPLKIVSTDRLGIRVHAQTTHSSPITVHWVYQGATHTSHFESGYFVCEPEPDSYNYAEQESIPPIIPLIAVAISMIAIVVYNRRREL